MAEPPEGTIAVDRPPADGAIVDDDEVFRVTLEPARVVRAIAKRELVGHRALTAAALLIHFEPELMPPSAAELVEIIHRFHDTGVFDPLYEEGVL